MNVTDMESNEFRKLFSIASTGGRNTKEDWWHKNTWNPHGDFILHTSQRCFGMLPSPIRKAAGFKVKKAYV